VARPALSTYTGKRNPDKTPEPMPRRRGSTAKASSDGPTFVIQEHHASALHWDFRLERDGVLVSWALPKGIPNDPAQNHLAVRVEDHPLEYGSFSGTIPEGEYGGGKVSIWDHGVYECEKWTPREVKVVLHGKRAVGRFVLFATQGKQWMIHRMDPVPGGFEPVPHHISPMLAVSGELPRHASEWAFEFKWDGIRALVAVDGGRPLALSRNGRDITASFPELRQLGEELGATQVLLDGELVAFDDSGKPSFSRLQRRTHVTGPRDVKRLAGTDPVSYVVFDLLHLNGRPLLDLSYDERRRELDGLHLGGATWAVTPSFTDTSGEAVLHTALEQGMEGVVAKRRSSVYRPGSRNGSWIKVKRERTQEVVVGGWTAGQGSRASGFGALLLGVPDGNGLLEYVGKVGTGFGDEEIERLRHRLRSLSRKTSPFGTTVPKAIGQAAHWVRPQLVGEVRFSEWTAEGRLRHPAWRGLRADKRPGDVIRET